jgi:hypothetical protein
MLNEIKKHDIDNIPKIISHGQNNDYCIIIEEFIDGVTPDLNDPKIQEQLQEILNKLKEKGINYPSYELYSGQNYYDKNEPKNPVKKITEITPRAKVHNTSNLILDKNGKLYLVDFGFCPDKKRLL